MRRWKLGLTGEGVLRVGIVITALVVVPSGLVAQSLTWLGTLGGFTSVAHGVSADGRVVVGWSTDATHRNYRAFCWTSTTGMQDLGTLGGSQGGSFSVSADGHVIVGWARNANDQSRAFRRENGVMQNLGVLYEAQSSWSEAHAVSADGSIVVGVSNGLAFRWTQSDGMQALESRFRVAYGMSLDGRVIVGRSDRGACLWQNGVIRDLGTLSGYPYSVAMGVSADGSVIVGFATDNVQNARAFRWENGTMQDIGTLPGYSYRVCAMSVSANGKIIVGWAENYNEQPRAFRWTASRGMEDLNQTYADLLGRSVLWKAYAISPNGRYIVGHGYNAATGRYEAFLLDTGVLQGDVNDDGRVDDTDLLTVLFNFSSGCIH
jgi:probable HAF family extracellular repeat protein